MGALLHPRQPLRNVRTAKKKNATALHRYSGHPEYHTPYTHSRARQNNAPPNSLLPLLLIRACRGGRIEPASNRGILARQSNSPTLPGPNAAVRPHMGEPSQSGRPLDTMPRCAPSPPNRPLRRVSQPCPAHAAREGWVFHSLSEKFLRNGGSRALRLEFDRRTAR